MLLADIDWFDLGHNPLGEVESVFVDVGQNHVPRAAMPSDHGSHNADGSRTGDNDVFTHHVERQRGMGCIAVGVKNGQ